MDKISGAQHRAKMCLQRLEAMKGRGKGNEIHDIMVWIAVVNGFKKLMDRPGRISRDEIADDLLESCKQAEAFILQHAEETYRNSGWVAYGG